MSTSVARVLVFLASLAVHGAVTVAFLAGFLSITDLHDPRLPLLMIGCLLVIAVFGFVVRRRWPYRWDGPMALGLIGAVVGMTAVFLWLSWALSHPIIKPPPFGEWLASTLRQRNASVWIMGPLVLSSLASALGYALGGRRSAQGSATNRNQGAV
jgi:hypothetical protein